MNNGTAKKVKIASMIAIICTLFSKLLGLLREMKIAQALGASGASDAYNVAYLLVITIFGLFSSAFSNSLMPIVAEQYTVDKKQMTKTVNEIVTISIGIMFAIIGLIYLFPNFFVKLIASGLDIETTVLAGELIKISAWALCFLVMSSAYVIVLRIYDKNIYPTIVDLLFPLPILTMLFLKVTSPHILIGGVVFGYGIKSVALVIKLKTVGFVTKINLSKTNPNIKRFFLFMPPMLLSSGLLQLNVLVDNQVASRFGPGSVTALSLASKVNSLAYTVFSTSLMQIIYSAMTKAHMRGDNKEFRNIVEKQTKMILMFIIPCFIVLFNFSTEIISILFVGGNYTYENAKIAGDILKGYALGLPLYVLRDICMYVYYSFQNSKFPSFVTAISVILNIGLNLILSRIIGIEGVAYATSLTVVVSLILLLAFMKRKAIRVKLISMNNLVLIVFTTVILWKIAEIFRTFLVEQTNWFGIVVFIVLFFLFWGIYFSVEFGVKSVKKLKMKRY